MLRPRFPSLTLVLSGLALAACGGRTNGGSPADEDTESPSTMGGAASSSDDSESPATSGPSSEESTSSTTISSSTSPTTVTATSSVPPEVTTTSTDPDGGTVTSPPIVEEPPEACPDQCGNGVVDTCEVCTEWPRGGLDPVEPVSPGLPIHARIAPPTDPICTTYTEQCDGTLGSEQTCESIGFAGGTLSCGATCNYDDAQCTSCLDGPEVRRCRDDLGVGAQPTHVALATNEVELGAAWNEGCNANVAWFDGTLDAVRTTTIASSPCVAATSGISLAPLNDDWVVELGSKQYVLAANGEVLSERDIAGSALFAAPRVGNTPLVVRQTSYRIVTASLLDATGEEVWTREVSSEVTEAHYGSATAVSDGFLVALRTDAGVQVFHLDGALGTLLDVSTPGSASTEYPQLGAADGEVRLVWADFGGTPKVQWATLDERGRRVGAAVEIGASPNYFNRSPIVVDGEDTVIAFGGYTGGTGIGAATHLRRIDAAGSTVAGDIAVQSDPNLVQWPQIVAFDGAFVTAWVGKGHAGRVGLAKIEL